MTQLESELKDQLKWNIGNYIAAIAAGITNEEATDAIMRDIEKYLEMLREDPDSKAAKTMPGFIAGLTTYKDGKRVGEMSMQQARQCVSAEGIGLILAEDACIEGNRISNVDFLAVRIAEAVESGVYNGFTKHLPHAR